MPASRGGQLKIADLERISGVPRSTVHHYLNLGLLPEPRVLGPKLHLFSDMHLQRVREIQRLRAQGLSLPRIRARLGRTRGKARDARTQVPGPDGTRRQIVEHATRAFAELGYQGVRMSDIASALELGKATLYRHFPNKRALFVDCVEHVRFTLIPAEQRHAVDTRANIVEQGRFRALGVLQNFEAYRTLTSLLGAVAHGETSEPELAQRAQAELHDMITNAEPYLRKLMAQKLIRPQNAELLSYMLWGALMGAGERLMLDDKLTLRQVLDAYLDFARVGMTGQAAEPLR